jgi:hypothetical protein
MRLILLPLPHHRRRIRRQGRSCHRCARRHDRRSKAPNGKNAAPYADYFPGRRYCDVLAADAYGEFKQEFYDDLAALGEGKPIDLGEVGGVSTPAILKEQFRWIWFMV